MPQKTRGPGALGDPENPAVRTYPPDIQAKHDGVYVPPPLTPPTLAEVNAGTWKEGPAQPVVLAYQQCVAVGNVIYSVGGLDASNNRVPNVYSLDTADSYAQWRTEPSLPFGRNWVGLVAVGTKLWSIGGYVATPTAGPIADVSIFDTANPGAGWVAGPSLPRARNHAAAAVVGTRIYVAGGAEATGGNNLAVYMIDTADAAPAWVEMATQLPEARADHSLVSIGTKLYLIGGNSAGTARRTYYVWDTETPAVAWALGTQSMLVNRLDAFQQAEVSQGVIYFLGGSVASAEAHDPVANTAWAYIPAPPGTVTYAGAAVAGGRLWLVGGAVSDVRKGGTLYVP